MSTSSAESVPPRYDYGDWPTLSEAELSIFTADLRKFLIEEQHHVIIGNRMALEDILQNCDSRPQFAKTFALLRQDLRRQLKKYRSDLSSTSDPMGQVFMLANIRMCDRVISHKLELMRAFFFNKWGENIEDWAGEEHGLLDRFLSLFY